MREPLRPTADVGKKSRAERVGSAVVFAIGFGAALVWQVCVWIAGWDQFTLGRGKSGLYTTWCLLAIPVDLLALGLWLWLGRKSIIWSIALALLTPAVWFVCIYVAILLSPIRILVWRALGGEQ